MTESYIRQQESNKRKMEAVYQFSNNGKFIGMHESIREAERATGTKASDISSCCKGKAKTAGGFIWNKVSDYA